MAFLANGRAENHGWQVAIGLNIVTAEFDDAPLKQMGGISADHVIFVVSGTAFTPRSCHAMEAFSP